jgi:hypothetical protein
VALDTTSVAGAVERTLDALVGTVRLIVADLSAVVALAGETATLRLVGAFAGEVAGLVAAVQGQYVKARLAEGVRRSNERMGNAS